MPETRAARSPLECRAILWKRFDFRESSRIVTLLTRERGRVGALAKGAHRPTSPFLGRLDFLNELQVRLSSDRGGLRLLQRAELLRERRALRAPRRFLAISHVAELIDFGFPEGQPDPELYDLAEGALALVERCPLPSLPAVVLGLELRLLARFGALPDLDRCGECGAPLADGAFRTDSGGGLACRKHAGPGRHAVSAAALAVLRSLRDQPARTWDGFAAKLTPIAVQLPARWLAAALDRRSRLRARVFARG
jgi:DNA repair protein RecO (recombination protein O)